MLQFLQMGPTWPGHPHPPFISILFTMQLMTTCHQLVQEVSESCWILLDPAGHSPKKGSNPHLTWSESPNSDNSISSLPNLAHPQITNLWVSGLQSKTDLNQKKEHNFIVYTLNSKDPSDFSQISPYPLVN